MEGVTTQQEVQPSLDSGHGLQREGKEGRERENRNNPPETIFRETTTHYHSAGNMTIKVLRTTPLGIFTEPLLADLVNDNVGFQIPSKRET